MKQAFIIIIASIFIIGCSSSIKTNEEKARDLISDFLKRNLNDPESYQEIEYGTIDSLKSIISYTDVFQHFDKYAQDESKNTQMRISASKRVIELLKSKNQPKGFSLSHFYRANNEFGAKMIEKKKFIFNDRIDSIITVIDVK